MVNSPQDLDRVFRALADSTRRGILAQLARDGQSSVGDLAEPHDMSSPAISKHLRVLEEAGLIERKIDGRVHRLRLSSTPLDEAIQWIEKTRRFWESRFDSLERHLERNAKRKEKSRE
ncbi:MAG TPA: metalloregulator ArsR/SmtB family transcription factor [Thermoanaerobaculia bacterium]|jgi:DNA-binding transcriptional ArsR family regulator|nr:metalloregulator ArsR/SmtB family transcription factor [Thermoanaerobaculia bacterium]